MQCWWLVSKGTVVLDPDGNIVDDTTVVDDDTGNPTDTEDTDSTDTQDTQDTQDTEDTNDTSDTEDTDPVDTDTDEPVEILNNQIQCLPQLLGGD